MTTHRLPANARRRRVPSACRTAAVVLIWLAVWQVAAWAVGSEVLLASPWQAAARLIELVPTGGFWAAVGFSTARIVGGFLLAMAVGSGLAVAGATWAFVAALLSPFMRVLRAVPVVSFVLLVLIWANSGTLSIVISFIMVMPVVYANVAAGCAARDPLLAELADVFDLNAARRWWAITLPGMMPYIVAAARIGLGLCWKAGISAEVIGLTSGSIGDRLYQAKLFLSTADLFCWTAVVVALAWAIEKLALAGLATVERRLGKAYAR